MLDKPGLYFRRRDKGASVFGASVFRIESGPHGRMDMVQIATLKPNGEVKTANKQTVDDLEMTQILDWFAARQSTQVARDTARIDGLIGDMNRATQWLQSDATREQVVEHSQDLLISLHDLRTTLVKRLSKP